jgi:ubiquitin carboxyl-terminal hydrolase 25
MRSISGSKLRVHPQICPSDAELDNDAHTLKSRLKQQFTDRRQHGYRLHSVFIHRGKPQSVVTYIPGDVTHGHYWIYIYDFAGNRWFKYNDEQVYEVDETVVFANNSAEGAGPYFLTYVKEDQANELVELLKRDVKTGVVEQEG